jgi:hypothetical protein
MGAELANTQGISLPQLEEHILSTIDLDVTRNKYRIQYTPAMKYLTHNKASLATTG